MTDTANTSTVRYNNIIELDDSDGIRHKFIRRVKGDGFFDIAKCEPSSDGTLEDGTDGVLVNAIQYSAARVAELVSEQEEKQEQLKRAAQSLRDYIQFREAWLRKPSRKGKLRLRKVKKEVVQ